MQYQVVDARAAQIALNKFGQRDGQARDNMMAERINYTTPFSLLFLRHAGWRYR